VRLTPRRRAVVALLVYSPLAYFFVGWSVDLVIKLLLRLRGGNYFGCGTGDVGLLDRFNGCGVSSFHTGYAVVELVLMCVTVVAVAYGLARWVVLPVQQVADTVTRFGPNAPRCSQTEDDPGPPLNENIKGRFFFASLTVYAI